MPRLKTKKFDSLEDMMDYYNDNKTEIHINTIEILEKFWNKNHYIDHVDIYNIKINGLPEVSKLSILKNEWEKALNEMEEHFVILEEYENAERALKLNKLVFPLNFKE